VLVLQGTDSPRPSILAGLIHSERPPTPDSGSQIIVTSLPSQSDGAKGKAKPETRDTRLVTPSEVHCHRDCEKILTLEMLSEYTCNSPLFIKYYILLYLASSVRGP